MKKYASECLKIILVAAFFLMGNQAVLMAEDSLVGWWRFDEGTGDVAHDSSDHSNHGKIHGAQWDQGRIGGAMRFNGTTDYIEVPPAVSLDLSTAMTLCAWIYWDTPPFGNWDHIFAVKGKNSCPSSGYAFISGWGSDLYLRLNNGANHLVANIPYLNPFKWQHLAATYDGQEAKLYLNGQLKTTVKGGYPIIKNNDPLYIGGFGKEGRAGFIDELRIYNRALSKQELQNLYADCHEFKIDAPLPLKALAFPADWERGSHIYLIEDEVTPLVFYLKGTGIKDIQEPRLHIESPSGLEILDGFQWVSDQQNSSPAVPLSISKKESKTKESGAEDVHWIVDIDQATLRLQKNFSAHNSSALCLFIKPKSKPSLTSEIHWYLECNGRRGNEQTLKINTVPPFDNRRVSDDFRVFLYDTEVLKCPNEKTWTQVESLYRKAGISGGGLLYCRDAQIEKLVKKGWELFSMCYMWGECVGWGVDADAFGDQANSVLAVLKDGTKSKRKRSLCPTYVIENCHPGSLYFWEAKKEVGKFYFPGAFGIQNDYELTMGSEFSPANSCFCPRCLQAFSKFSNVSAKNLTSQDLLNKYKKEWFEFRFWQLAKMMDVFSKIVHAIDPKAKAMACAHPIMKDKSWNPTGMEIYDDWVDEHWPMIYTKGIEFYLTIERQRIVKKPWYPLIGIPFPPPEVSPGYRADDVKNNILACAASGASGVCLFLGSTSLDGGYLRAIGEASREIATVESFFKNRKRNDKRVEVQFENQKGNWERIREDEEKLAVYSDFPNPSSRDLICKKVHVFGDKILISLYNYDYYHRDQPAALKLSFPDLKKGPCRLYDAVDGKSIFEGETDSERMKGGILYSIEYGSVKFLILEKKDL
ncbi:MAG: LamG domain-containing protein [Verrucomicrobia bacterium]|nr:LamG domain-containing protein [Verrucomicrobiota bacterium]MBU1735155.1 LamG domain-containing protein [Verrucomicrobiota bacterium]MBU1856440.1 LamG domain-containing protein [Verrucomicrobiota bacterium]